MKQKAALLIHGLGDTPFQMQDLERHFQSLGYATQNICLPGHGTQPKDLLKISYKTWIKAVEETATELKKQHTSIVICGFSTGASLAIEYTARHPEKIDTLYLLCPAVKIKAKLACLAWLPALLGKIIKPLAWASRNTEDNKVKYSSFTFNSGWQVHKLGRRIRNLKLETRMQIFLSMDDETIDTPAAINFFKKQPNKKNHCLVFSNSPLNENDPRIEWHKATCPAMKVVNISHVGIMIDPNNPYYGINGEYTLQLQKQSGFKRLGAVNGFEERVGTKQLTRLYFNPWFDKLKKFIF